MKNLDNTVDFLKSKIPNKPKVAVILGSGLGDLGVKIESPTVIPYSDIPEFPQSRVKGHAYQLIAGKLNNVDVLAMQGRFHYFEGYSMKDITYPIRVFKKLGIETLILSTASGAINANFQPGELVIIKDHINMMGDNPLIGPNDDSEGPRFLDLSCAYDKKLIQKAKRIGSQLNIHYQEGVHCALAGPTYETAAEIRFLSQIGVDTVSMSSIPEVIVANHVGMRVLAFACITNMGTGIATSKHSHEAVVAMAESVAHNFSTWVYSILPEIDDQ